MGVSDPIADMLTRIRNASRIRGKYVDVMLSRVNQDICRVLKKAGYISGFDVKKGVGKHEVLRVYLKYLDGKISGISGIQRVSRPGRRVYVRNDKIPRVLDGYGVAIVSTSRGIMTDKEAKMQNLGGELLCSVW